MKFKSCIMLFIFLLMAPGTVLSRELTFGYAHFPPFMCSGRPSPTGIDIQLVKEIAKRLELSVVFKEYPFRRLLKSMESGQIDIMPSLAKRPEREKYMHYLAPSYYALGPTFYVQKGKENTIQHYNDLHKLTVGMSADSAFFQPFDNDQNITRYLGKSETQLLGMLSKDRIDTMIGSNAQIDFLLKQRGLEKEIAKAIYRPNKVTHVFFALSKNSPFAKEADRFDKVLKDIIDTKLLDKFISRQCSH